MKSEVNSCFKHSFMRKKKFRQRIIKFLVKWSDSFVTSIHIKN